VVDTPRATSASSMLTSRARRCRYPHRHTTARSRSPSRATQLSRALPSAVPPRQGHDFTPRARR
jgi:hypothetical protein